MSKGDNPNKSSRGNGGKYKKLEAREMITEKQKDYILDLYKEIDIEPEEDIDNLTKQQASKLIDELKEIKDEIS